MNMPLPAAVEEDVLTIRTERTPNPNSLKYIVGRMLIPGGSANFPSPESAAGRSPLASRLFAVPNVHGVFIGADFFTVTRTEGVEWAAINAGLAPALEAFFESGESVLTARSVAAAPMVGDAGVNPELVAKIEQLLDEKIRPAVANDGGDIVYRGFKDGVVYLELHGACSSCPSSTATLKMGVETMLRSHLPNDVLSVEAL
jgi:Fe-S cluster biogenesis protein NfuA